MLNRDNLTKLARYLATLPDDYEAFDMELFFSGPSDYVEVDYARKNGGVDKCGAVACAVGHGPSAGILVPDHLILGGIYVSWSGYVREFFIETYGRGAEAALAFGWMFDDAWTEVDNTPKGAAKRILWLLEHGIDAIPLDDENLFVSEKLVDLYKDMVL